MTKSASASVAGWPCAASRLTLQRLPDGRTDLTLIEQRTSRPAAIRRASRAIPPGGRAIPPGAPGHPAGRAVARVAVLAGEPSAPFAYCTVGRPARDGLREALAAHREELGAVIGSCTAPEILRREASTGAPALVEDDDGVTCIGDQPRRAAPRPATPAPITMTRIRPTSVSRAPSETGLARREPSDRACARGYWGGMDRVRRAPPQSISS